MAKVLVIEDETTIREQMVRALSYEGYEAQGAANGIEGLRLTKSLEPDVVVADLLMPELDGYGLVSFLRSPRGARATPVIMVTAVHDRAAYRRLMELGADDFITKPFAIEELVGAVKAQIRKRQWREDKPQPAALRFGSFTYYPDERRLEGGKSNSAMLSVNEGRLLEIFLAHANRVMPRGELFAEMRRTEKSPFDRSIDVLVCQLRRRIEEKPRSPRLIQTVRSTGYILRAEVTELGLDGAGQAQALPAEVGAQA